MNVLALDLSLTATGVCVDAPDGPEADLLAFPRLRGWERNRVIVDHLLAKVRDWRPEVVVLEGYSFGSKGRSVFDIAELGGVVRWELARAGLPWVAVPPATLKKYATGKGNAPKDAMVAEAVRRFAFPGHDNNEADAWLLWHMAHDALAGDSPVRVPVANRAALDAVDWSAVGRNGASSAHCLPKRSPAAALRNRQRPGSACKRGLSRKTVSRHGEAAGRLSAES